MANQSKYPLYSYRSYRQTLFFFNKSCSNQAGTCHYPLQMVSSVDAFYMKTSVWDGEHRETNFLGYFIDLLLTWGLDTDCCTFSSYRMIWWPTYGINVHFNSSNIKLFVDVNADTLLPTSLTICLIFVIGFRLLVYSGNILRMVLIVMDLNRSNWHNFLWQHISWSVSEIACLRSGSCLWYPCCVSRHWSVSLMAPGWVLMDADRHVIFLPPVSSLLVSPNEKSPEPFVAADHAHKRWWDEM